VALAKRLQHYWHDQGYPAARFWTEPLNERFDQFGTYEVYQVKMQSRETDCRHGIVVRAIRPAGLSASTAAGRKIRHRRDVPAGSTSSS
jgi:hypothetical protein